MTVIVKPRSQLSVPASVQRKARIKPGDRLEVKGSGSVITIIPKLPSANDEDAAEQRRGVDAQLAKALADIREGRVSPRFDRVDDMLASLKEGTVKRACRKPSAK